MNHYAMEPSPERAALIKHIPAYSMSIVPASVDAIPRARRRIAAQAQLPFTKGECVQGDLLKITLASMHTQGSPINVKFL